MSRIEKYSTADLFFQINWSSPGVTHSDAFAGHRSNFWRDMLPPKLQEKLMGQQSGETVQVNLTTEDLLGERGKHDLHTIKRKQFCGNRIHRDKLLPRIGRFYPKGLLENVTGIFKENIVPFRCVSKQNGHLGVAMGHPLAGHAMDVAVTVGSIRSPLEERGGSVRDWGEIITQGVGMQARWKDQPTDFFSDRPFERKDTSDDILFYEEPRMVHHLDDTAIDMVRHIYGKFLNPESKILDLMSSWQSYLPKGQQPAHVTGLGLNELELRRNEFLNAYVVHDVNTDSRLPFDEHSFGMVICNVSVEYLISPRDIFNEVARVLQPGGYFVVSFSNRWFEPKVIRIWTEMSEFERMGLVLEYFRHNRRFDDLGTYSIRGLPRPEHDKYYGQIAYSDPVYAVWGRKI